MTAGCFGGVARLRGWVVDGHPTIVSGVGGQVSEAEGDHLVTDSSWWRGPVGWVLEEVVPLPTPVVLPGAQGLWRLPAGVLKAVRYGWRAGRVGGAS